MATVREAFGKLCRSLYSFGTAVVTGVTRTAAVGISVAVDSARAAYDIYNRDFGNLYKYAANIFGIIYAPVLTGAAYLLSFGYDLYMG